MSWNFSESINTSRIIGHLMLPLKTGKTGMFILFSTTGGKTWGHFVPVRRIMDGVTKNLWHHDDKLQKEKTRVFSKEKTWVFSKSYCPRADSQGIQEK